MAIDIQGFLAKKESNIVNTSVFRLQQEYHPKKKTLHVFVENLDDFHFYRNWIKQFFPDFKVLEYLQNGKDGVNDTYRALNWSAFAKERVLFFRDKDFDDFLQVQLINDHNFFITSHYSIENYLVDDNIFELILREIFALKHEDYISDLKAKFKAAHDKFNENLILITAWILIYRKIESHMKLDDLKMSDFFYSEQLCLYFKRLVKPLDFETIMKNPHSRSLDRLTIRVKKIKKILEESTGADPQNYSIEEMLSNYRLLRGIQLPKSYIRGKYELWFFIECCLKNVKSVVKDLNDQIKQFNRKEENVEKISKIDCKIEIEEKNIFMVIPALMKQIPDDIHRFLSTNSAKFYGNN